MVGWANRIIYKFWMVALTQKVPFVWQNFKTDTFSRMLKYKWYKYKILHQNSLIDPIIFWSRPERSIKQK